MRQDSLFAMHVNLSGAKRQDCAICIEYHVQYKNDVF